MKLRAQRWNSWQWMMITKIIHDYHEYYHEEYPEYHDYLNYHDYHEDCHDYYDDYNSSNEDPRTGFPHCHLGQNKAELCFLDKKREKGGER